MPTYLSIWATAWHSHPSLWGTQGLWQHPMGRGDAVLECQAGAPWDLWVAYHRQEQQEDTRPSFCLEERGTAHTSALFVRGSRYLQPFWETLSCLACLQAAGQDAGARHLGLEWPS